jgi:hypothetical protein
MANPPSFDRDIRALFRESDRLAMSYLFDLSVYRDVKEEAANILERLEDGTMPCDEPWTPANLALFRAWIDGDCAP